MVYFFDDRANIFTLPLDETMKASNMTSQVLKKDHVSKPQTTHGTGDLPKTPKRLQEYIQTLESQLREEQAEREALNLERAKLKVCWEMTLEELSATRVELAGKISKLESQLKKQLKRKKVLQNLLKEYGKNMEELKKTLDNIFKERPRTSNNIKR